MFPSNLNWMAIIAGERIKRNATHDRDEDADWNEIIESIRLEFIRTFRDHCIVNPKGHVWVCKYEREHCSKKMDKECNADKLCQHCNIWQELLEPTEIPVLTDGETGLIAKNNPELFTELRKSVALARSHRILKKIVESEGMIVPLAEAKTVLNMPAFIGLD